MLIIRDANTADISFLVDCNMAMAMETEQKTLVRPVLARGVAAVFEQIQRGFYLIADDAGYSVGCLLVTFEWSDWRAGTWWWLQSVYVIPAARHGGVFRALHTEVASRARAGNDVAGLRLYVEQDNTNAQRTYASLGMRQTHYDLYEQPFREASCSLAGAPHHLTGS